MAAELQMQKKHEATSNGAEKPEPTYIPADQGEPKFDFSRVSRKWAKRWLRVSAQAMQDTFIVDSVPAHGITDDEKRRVVQGKLEAAERLGNVLDERDKLIAEVLIFVPRHWLSADAPEGLVWSDPESLDWVLESKSKALNDALEEARNGGN